MSENLIQLKNGYKSYGSRELFEDASFAINEDEHVGVIGPNGAGKTTLFKTILGEEMLDSGEWTRSRSLRLGYLSQHDHFKEGETVEAYLESVSDLPLWELKAFGRDLGLNDSHYEKEILSLSGGYRMRCKLLALLGKSPNLMLLDEPTNYLDLETTLVLERFLQNFKGTFLLISHDREFLRRTTDHTLEVEAGEITKYNGNIDDYFEQKTLLKEQLEARAMSLADKRKAVMDFVNRFGAKASKAKQAQSRLKMVSKMETIELKPVPVSARIRIPTPIRTGKQILKIQDMTLGYGTGADARVILTDVNLELKNGDHLAIVGLNGAGKSTLLKALAGRLKPLKGSIETGYEVSISFFAQHVVEELNASHTVFESMSEAAHKEVFPQEILEIAGSLLFTGDLVQKKISVLSGGEKSRVALGRMLLRKNPCLILDEPTNHLDFQTVEALTEALRSYPGCVVVVSHDRGFVSRVGTKILEVNQGKVRVYPGSYNEYVWSIEKGALSIDTSDATRDEDKRSKPSNQGASSGSTEVSKGGKLREEKKALEKKLKQCERLIELSEREIKEKDALLSSLNEKLTRLTDAGENSANVIREMGEVQARLSELEKTWVDESERRETLSDAIAKMMG